MSESSSVATAVLDVERGRRTFRRLPATCPLTGTPFVRIVEAVESFNGIVHPDSGEKLTWEQFAALDHDDRVRFRRLDALPPIDHCSSPAERFEAVCTPVAFEAGLMSMPQTRRPVDLEVDRLEADGYHHLADVLRSQHPAEEPKPRGPKALFDSGDVQIDRKLVGLGVPLAALIGFVGRHVAGDHGLEGSSVGFALTREQEYFSTLFGVDVQNAAAVKSGLGLVRSTYALDVPNRREFACVLTLLIPGRESRTIVYRPS